MSYSEDATSHGHCCEPTLLQLEVVKLFEERVLVHNILRKQPIVVNYHARFRGCDIS